jgi:hypothetical protein
MLYFLVAVVIDNKNQLVLAEVENKKLIVSSLE